MRELTTVVAVLDAANNATGRALEGMQRANAVFLALERIAAAGGDNVAAGLAREGTTMLDDYIDTASGDVEEFFGAWKRATGAAVPATK
ncbi:hypothetical protein LMG27952_01746 [Paraburkholderia hiiakae]|uniref:Uncharacterized protein n=1 Tax=Paraburkholderia hiiakae TaxID=1081782 RepID=A0ABN7HKN3_9BURK|nr:hypothetical protein [Paraburkholderia hiiakae]CAD6524635.1 hypothetical protein LMG27952_01746 [Paraburkholderia hiiakae]